MLFGGVRGRSWGLHERRWNLHERRGSLLRRRWRELVMLVGPWRRGLLNLGVAIAGCRRCRRGHSVGRGGDSWGSPRWGRGPGMFWGGARLLCKGSWGGEYFGLRRGCNMNPRSDDIVSRYPRNPSSPYPHDHQGCLRDVCISQDDQDRHRTLPYTVPCQ
jgi:hypothetical protein